MDEINLDNPIFTFYIDISGMSKMSADKYLAEIRNCVTYSNITTWVMPINAYERSGQTRVECTYQGRNSKDFDSINNQLNELIELISNSESLDTLKQSVREWRINKIIN